MMGLNNIKYKINIIPIIYNILYMYYVFMLCVQNKKDFYFYFQSFSNVYFVNLRFDFAFGLSLLLFSLLLF